jgi:hypothetical protein
MSSRARNITKYGVIAPRSTTLVEMQMMWSMIRENSERITRTASARGGAGTPRSFSTARAQPCPFMNDEQ